ncbi:nucleotide pyrophosphohydrolase [Micromonospora soli]|uniref:nucleotide pyrophosphohydrolase n=1 Tax=Micromonospora sp. NBRC 110009 TaxID=3061627 RepID=UPI002672D62B|nr:nucleotide pyrophosphohydrolase [Micromonospora sp. NBRC 110009]WKT98280.1 nucleotide pyrophosphohydrolase [Micromonospora sp. NBRC 110009]
MDLAELQARARAVAERYDRHHETAGRAPWTTEDLTLGFVGDLGDLAKLVLAVEGRRELPGARERLGHELADCLWSVLVLADRYDVDLAAEFARMTSGVERHLDRLAGERPGRMTVSRRDDLPE